MRKSTWAAVAIFMILGTASLYTLTRKPERGITRLAFSTIETDAIDKIEVTGQSPITLTKKDGVWYIPGGHQADKAAVEALLSNTKRIRSDEVITQDSNRFGEMEVDAEKGRDVSLYAGSQKVAQFVVGKFLTGPAGPNTTAMRSGDTVYKVKDVFTYVFGHTPMEWRERHVFSETLADVSRLNVHLKDGASYTMASNEKGWELLADSTQPENFRFEAGAGQALANAALTLQAQELLETDPGMQTTQLGPDADALTWYFRDSAQATTHVPSRTLYLGAAREDKQVYARIEGREGVFTVPEYAANGLRKDLTQLRDLTVMQVDPAQVVGLSIQDGKTKFALERDDAKSDWRVRGKAPANFTLDPAKATRRLNMTLHARATGMAPAKQGLIASGLKPAKSQIVLTFADKKSATLTFGNKTKSNDGYFSTGNVDSEIYVIGTQLHDQLMGGLDTLKKTGASSDPLAQLDPKAFANLPPEIRANLQAQIAKKQQEQMMQQNQR